MSGSSPAELIGIEYSPWTEKARWAMDYHGLPYRYREHLILLGMPELRLRTGKWTGDLTVPALIAGKETLFDSFDIARYASTHGPRHSGRDKRLLTDELLPEIRKFNEMSEAALDAGRALAIDRLAGHRQARLENVPPFVPKALRPLMLPMVTVGIGYIRREFHVNPKARDNYEEKMESALEAISEATAHGTKPYLLGRFTYADVVVAAALQFVQPPDDRHVRITPGIRECWRHERLARKFEHLLSWRNSLYEKHRHGANS